MENLIRSGKYLLNQKGISYLYVLLMIVVIEIGLLGISNFWQATSKRDNEEELLFRGSQIQKAIGRYYNKYRIYPSSMDDLIKDSRTAKNERYLRKPYKDPLAKDGEWQIIKDSSGRIAGVSSSSVKKPYKMTNFPFELRELEGKEKYSEWKFIYILLPAVQKPQPLLPK